MSESLALGHDNSVAVFLGPSLSLQKAKQILPAAYYPPVKLGDLYKLLSSPLQTVVIIDGLFDGSTPVWQREILALLEAGKTVLGASSMGALRAAELSPYGMQGFGVIYQWYRDGVIDGDDEVGLLHGAEQIGYVKISEPLVNIRFNLQAAYDEKIINASQRDSLLQFAKSSYFGDRKLPMLIERLGEQGDSETASLLAEFFTSSYVDIKERDAISLLGALAAEEPGKIKKESTEIVSDWYERPARYGSRMHETEIFHGSIFLPDGTMVSHKTLIDRLAANWSDYEADAMKMTEQCYLVAMCSIDNQTSEVSDKQQQVWCESSNIRNLPVWLSANGMTLADWQHRVAVDCAIAANLNNQTSFCSEKVNELNTWIGEANEISPRECLDSKDSQLGLKILLFNQWAISCGYCCPSDWSQKVLQWQRDNSSNTSDQLASIVQVDMRPIESQCLRAVSMYSWMMTKGPAYFGFSFNPLMSVFKSLQMQCRIGELR